MWSKLGYLVGVGLSSGLGAGICGTGEAGCCGAGRGAGDGRGQNCIVPSGPLFFLGTKLPPFSLPPWRLAFSCFVVLLPPLCPSLSLLREGLFPKPSSS